MKRYILTVRMEALVADNEVLDDTVELDMPLSPEYTTLVRSVNGTTEIVDGCITGYALVDTKYVREDAA